MEAITGLVLILLSSVGARNIPGHTDYPSESDGQSSYKKTPLATIFPVEELVQSVAYVADLPLNTNNEQFENVEDHDSGIMDLDNDIIENMDVHESTSYKEKKIGKPNKEDKADGVVRPVEVNNNQKGDKVFGFRVALVGGCPKGTVRVGIECMVEVKG
ncbi:hypothetical protein PYW08_008978 [Mythimna loreyi]|uniref:Uncharacterized protein n=1 Tax=Mythimna loreyi TaxID=667449 RepID=A0ACC2Q7F7_9NEOP|nr:hypothetical protein PYW08_008978 [Mythimna loreyi]